MQTRAFTLIEMLLVLSIIGIVFLLMRPVFDNTYNNDPIDCLQSLYQEANHFVFAGLQPQSITSGAQIIIPDGYRVQISGSIIIYTQEYSGQTVVYNDRLLNTHSDMCSINNGELLLSGNLQQLTIQNNIVTINSGALFTGSIELRTCITNTGCNYIGQMIVDTRTQRLYIPYQ